MVDAHSACHCFLGIAEASRVYRRYSGYAEGILYIPRWYHRYAEGVYLSPSSTDLYFKFSSILCQHKTQKAETIKTTNNNLYRNVLQYGSFSTIYKKNYYAKGKIYIIHCHWLVAKQTEPQIHLFYLDQWNLVQSD